MTLLPLPPTTTSSIASKTIHYATPSPASSPYIAAPPRIVIVADKAPGWITDVERRINELLALGPDWDTYGAQPVRLEHVVSGLSLLQTLAGIDSPVPAIVPTAARGIQFEWETDHAAVEVRVGDDGRYVYVQDDSGEAEGEATPELVSRAAAAISSVAWVA